jgi:hypothetical protein
MLTLEQFLERAPVIIAAWAEAERREIAKVQNWPMHPRDEIDWFRELIAYLTFSELSPEAQQVRSKANYERRRGV